jgi:thioredoxin 1
MKHIAPSDFDQEMLQAAVPVLVDFYTDGCGPCRDMAPVIAEVEAESGGTLRSRQ